MLPAHRPLRALVDGYAFRRLTPIALRLVAAGSLPPRIREAYGCRWTRVEGAAFPLAVEAIRRAYLHLPDSLRFHVAYRRAVRRTRGANEAHPAFTEALR
jgi:uncharacterized protein (DUF2236 family)